MARIPRLSDYRVVFVSDGFIVPSIWGRSFGRGGLFILAFMIVLEQFQLVWHYIYSFYTT